VEQLPLGEDDKFLRPDDRQQYDKRLGSVRNTSHRRLECVDGPQYDRGHRWQHQEQYSPALQRSVRTNPHL